MGKVEIAISKELNRFIKDGITQSELDEAKRNLLTNPIDARSTDGGIASTLRLDLYLGHGLQWDAAFEKSIADVTFDEVNSAIRRYIRPAAISTFVAGDFARTTQTSTANGAAKGH